MSTMVTCPACGVRWQSQATSGRTRCGRCRTVVALPAKARRGRRGGAVEVTCSACGHSWRSVSSSGHTRCGACRTPVYMPVVERGEGGGDRAIRPVRVPLPERDRVPAQPRPKPTSDPPPPASLGAPLLATLGSLGERWVALSSDWPASVPAVAPVLPRVAASVPAGPAVPVRLRCGHTAVVSGPRTAVVGREIACPTCGAWTRVEAPAVRRCPACTTGIAQCPLPACPMP